MSSTKTRHLHGSVCQKERRISENETSSSLPFLKMCWWTALFLCLSQTWYVEYSFENRSRAWTGISADSTLDQTVIKLYLAHDKYTHKLWKSTKWRIWKPFISGYLFRSQCRVACFEYCRSSCSSIHQSCQCK